MFDCEHFCIHAVTRENILIEFVTQEPDCKLYSGSVAFSANTFVFNEINKDFCMSWHSGNAVTTYKIN